MWQIFVTFRDFGNKAKPARNAKLRKFEERGEKWSHSMAAADKWAREKDDFRKDSGSFCGSCTECVRRVRLVPLGSFGVAAAAAEFGLGRFLRFPSGQMMIVAV